MDIYQLSALMAEQRRAERLVQAERRRAAQVASHHPSRRAWLARTANRAALDGSPALHPAGSRQEAGGPCVRAWHRLGHALRPRSLPLSKVPGDLR